MLQWRQVHIKKKILSLNDMKTATNQMRVLIHQPMHVIHADINLLSEFCQIEAIVRHLRSTHLIIQFVQFSKNFKWYAHVTIQILHQKCIQWYHLYFWKWHSVLGFTQDLATLLIENVRITLSSVFKVHVRESHFLLYLVLNYSISISEAPFLPSAQTEL